MASVWRSPPLAISADLFLSTEPETLMKSLPPELCHQILRIAGGPPDDFDGRLLRWKPVSALVDHLYLPKLRTAAQLVRVCRHWNEIVTPILYENIIISTVAQLILVTATLELKTDGRGVDTLGRLVKRIVIVPTDSFTVNSSDFHQLIVCCPTLTALHLTRHFEVNPSPFIKTILQTTRTLQVLSWGGVFLGKLSVSPWTDILEKMTTLWAFRHDFSSTPSHIPPNIKFLSTCDHFRAPPIPSSVKELMLHCFNLPLHVELRSTSITKLTLICTFAGGDRPGDLLQQTISSIPESVTALSLLLWSWDSISAIKSIPQKVAFLGLETRRATDDLRPLVNFCESVDAPALDTVQIMNWDECEHLRRSRFNMSTKLASTLRRRNIDLIDWEGFLIV